MFGIFVVPKYARMELFPPNLLNFLFANTGPEGALTVMVEVSVNDPSLVVYVMVALPTPCAVTNPVVLTVATPVLLLDQVPV